MHASAVVWPKTSADFASSMKIPIRLLEPYLAPVAHNTQVNDGFANSGLPSPPIGSKVDWAMASRLQCKASRWDRCVEISICRKESG